MKIENLVNGYVLTNLFYELMFLDEHGIEESENDWENQKFVGETIRNLVLARFDSFSSNTKIVVHNTLSYLLVAEPESSDIWDAIWQASAAPVPTPYGIKYFVRQCYDVLFAGEPLPEKSRLLSYRINHDSNIANRLN